MNIGIIGAGEMGSCLASKFVKLGHAVSIANSRGPASLQQLVGEIGATAATVEEAIRDKDVIVISIPVKNIPALPVHLFQHLGEDVVVIDTGNYYPNLRDGAIASLEETGIDSLWVQQQLGFPVVKVFNSILATSLQGKGMPKGEKGRIALALSGDNAKAIEVVSGLVDALGFDAFDMGTIAQSWKQQPGSPLYCRDLNIEELKKRVNALMPEQHEAVIAKRETDEVLMKTDYPAYLKSLEN